MNTRIGTASGCLSMFAVIDRVAMQLEIGETQLMPMDSSCAVISFNSARSDSKRRPLIASGEGELLRTFSCSGEVRTALRKASVGTAVIEDKIDGLDDGGSLQVAVNAEQFTAFYRRENRSEERAAAAE